jgi:acyl carrier protein
MTPEAARSAVLSALSRIAPEVDVEALGPSASLRQQADLDSMNVLELLAQLSDATGVPLEDEDLPKLTSLDATVALLVARSATAESP